MDPNLPWEQHHLSLSCAEKDLTHESFSCEPWARSKVSWSWWKDSCCLQRICDQVFVLANAFRKGWSPLLLLWSHGCSMQWKTQLKAEARLWSVLFFRVYVKALIHLWTPTYAVKGQIDSSWSFWQNWVTSRHLILVLFLPYQLLSPLAVRRRPQLLWMPQEVLGCSNSLEVRFIEKGCSPPGLLWWTQEVL